MTFFDGKLPADLSALPPQAQQELVALLQSQTGQDTVSLPAEITEELKRRAAAIDSGTEALTPASVFLNELAAKYT